MRTAVSRIVPLVRPIRRFYATSNKLGFPENASGNKPEKDFISTKQLNKDSIQKILEESKRMKELVEAGAASDMLKGKVLANMFLEPSTRTRSSFHSAMVRLGGSVIPIDDLTSDSKKGETLQDAIKSIENFVDIIALRHSQIGSSVLASKYATVPVINAGDGSGEHPTQALLDLFCIYDKLGTIDGLTITMVGDLKYGRTVHSLTHLLAHYNVTLNFVSQPQLPFPSDMVDDLLDMTPKVKIVETPTLEPLLAKTDVLYATRVQKERITDAHTYDAVKDYYRITPEVMKQFNPKGIVMHPLPRIKEISERVDDDPRCIYFQQPKYGLYVRMALLAGLLGKL